MFVSVLLPLPVKGAFSYKVPEDWRIHVAVGSRVLVQFGHRNYYTAVVESVSDTSPIDCDNIKDVMMVLDPHPVLRYPQLKFWHWIAQYYLCTPGEVFKAALPSGLKVESETYVMLNKDYEQPEDYEQIHHAARKSEAEKEAVIIALLRQKQRLRVSEIEKESGYKSLGSTIHGMLSAGMLLIGERLVDKYVSKKETLVTLACERNDQDSLHEMFDKVRRSQAQESLLVAYIEMSRWLRPDSLKDVLKKELLLRTSATSSVFKALVDKKIFEVHKRDVNRFASGGDIPTELPKLSSVQLKAYNEIVEGWKDKSVMLLHGVTGSGKTEIYAHLMQAVLQQGNQVLYLVPEISLTTQLTTRLRSIFGDRLLIYHSKFSDSERVDIWKKLLETHEPMIVLGVRSSVFLPFARLGLAIVDEEHEASYKQYDPAPRYNARDAAIVLASMHGAHVLLGSATPSIETYYKALQGKYGLVKLTTRFSPSGNPDDTPQLPNVCVVDMREQRKKHLNNGIFSDKLLKHTGLALKEGKQVIMFQNRRGFAPVVTCTQCGWTPKCPNCDVSLVFHRSTNELKCHYCGHTMQLPNVCPDCGLNAIDKYGYGTERIADNLHSIFPNYSIARMDLDTTRNKNGYQDIIEDFSRGETRILVGTQMVAKGLDFKDVTTVGILSADMLLHYPDFRATERAFNMMEQVSGRAGRSGLPGTVVVQTTRPDHPVIEDVCRHDYHGYFNRELAERENFNYPPFTRVIYVVMRHKDNALLIDVAKQYGELLCQVFGRQRVLGPEAPSVARVSTYYFQRLMLKIESGASMLKVKNILTEIYEKACANPKMRKVDVYYDVDPV